MRSARRALLPVIALAPLFAVACDSAPENSQEALAPSAALTAGAPSLVNERGFNTKATSSNDVAGSEGWKTTEYKSPRFTIASAGDAPKSAPNVAQVLLPAGMTGGTDPARANEDFGGEARTVSVDLWNQLSANWQGSSKAASVIFSLNVSGSRRLSFEAVGSGSGALKPAISLWGAPDSRDRLLPNLVSDAQVARGQWQQWRVTVRMNTIGQKDGYVQVSLNGTPVLRYADVEFASSGQDWFNQFDWKPKWGGSGDVVAADMTMRWDHVIIRASAGRVEDGSGELPPPPSDSTPTTPPSPTITAVVVSPDTAQALVGASQQFAASARDAAGNIVTTAPMTWSSSDPTTATVSATGLATGVKAGRALIIATSGSFADTARFGVVAPTSEPSPSPSPTPTGGYYVAPNGSSGNSGTASSPWDLQTALNGAGGKIQPGDTVWVRGGTYPNGGTLSVNGSSAGQVVFSGYPGETAIIKRQFKGTGDYVTIQHLVFEGPINMATNQVFLYDCHHVVFTRNEIRNGDFHAGLSVDEAHHMVITYNYIHDNGIDNSHDHGIYFKTTSGDGNVISNNLLVRNAARGLSMHDNTGVGVHDVVVAHNTVYGNGSTGILVNDADRITLANNVAMNNGDKTGQRQIRVIAGNANKIYNNLTWHSSASSRAGIENTTSSEMTGNKIADPLFTSATDWRIRDGSPAIGLGLGAFNTKIDYAWKQRDTAPDAGAYER